MISAQWLSFIALGAITGVLSGLVGVGGGIILVPALVFFYGFTQHQAQGTTLAMLLLPVGLLAVQQYYKRGQVDTSAVLGIAIGFFAGGFFGGKLAGAISQVWLTRGFGIFMLIAAARLIAASFR